MSSWSSGRLLLVGTFLKEPGRRAVSEDLATRLRAHGWHVELTSSKATRGARAWDMVLTTWRQRRGCDLALVDLYSGPAALWAISVCLLWRLVAGRPYILTLHGGNLPQFADSWPIVVRVLFRHAAAVTAPSRYLLSRMAPYRCDVRLIPNGIELRPLALPGSAGVKPHLVWIRAFHDIYNPTMAVRVLAALKQDVPGATLTMAGPDKGDGSLARTIAEAERLGVGDSLTLAGAVDKAAVPDLLARAGIFINTTNVDNTPVSVLEAMGAGVPVVSSNVGGLPYLIDDEVDGLLVGRDDVTAMAGAIRRLLERPAMAGDIAARAAEKARGFDWSVVAPQWLRLLADTKAGKYADSVAGPQP